MTYAIARGQIGFVDFIGRNGEWTFDANEAVVFSTRREATEMARQEMSDKSPAPFYTVSWPGEIIQGRDGLWRLFGGVEIDARYRKMTHYLVNDPITGDFVELGEVAKGIPRSAERNDLEVCRLSNEWDAGDGEYYIMTAVGDELGGFKHAIGVS